MIDGGNDYYLVTIVSVMPSLVSGIVYICLINNVSLLSTLLCSCFSSFFLLVNDITSITYHFIFSI